MLALSQLPHLSRGIEYVIYYINLCFINSLCICLIVLRLDRTVSQSRACAHTCIQCLCQHDVILHLSLYFVPETHAWSLDQLSMYMFMAMAVKILYGKAAFGLVIYIAPLMQLVHYVVRFLKV